MKLCHQLLKDLLVLFVLFFLIIQFILLVILFSVDLLGKFTVLSYFSTCKNKDSKQTNK